MYVKCNESLVKDELITKNRCKGWMDMIKIVFVVRIRSRVNNKYLKRNMVNISEFDRIYKIARIVVNGTNLKDSR